MANVSYTSFINDDGVREKREFVDAGARTLIQAQEQKIAALEEVDEDFRGGPILLNTQQANNTFEGRDIEVLFEAEIANGYANAWEYLADRVDLAKTAGKKAYAGLRERDFMNVPVESNTYPYEIGGFDYDRRCGDPEQGPSIIMVTHMAFPERVKWNNTNDNNGTAAQPFPYLASNVYDYLNNTLLPKFPAEVRAVMKERIALIESRYSASGKLTASNNWAWKPIGRLWLPSEPELFGRNQWGDPYGDAQGSQFPNFRDPSDRIFRTPAGERSGVWSRSVAAGGSVGACHAAACGYADPASAAGTWVGVAPCFLIG
ncbi:hypothetical protein ADLECEL_24540 [Adlercreutzia equolifaciens subsp. celatus]|uniref:DUF6273 domain-containing protein n=1 Tax=Adlercreutzia equolifaciens subsp. celatus DSM 18785 TaxID=1121021 RepID=A0A3N0API4_9ACTN|nr:DUF6273 domain-containing protein [Adlercreutzia equolifaciens]MCP2078633.1 hypothetical protein [Adlercreutzia equolifaciens subsp. celatus DSM 18785]RFT93180.1 hypothetical protein DX904_04695 [Adlercreutzia equolifaciens subsp. celatus]RNL36710.1 hypothetical protein DMP10_10430 [Adlercreutzia equolifaciens subsp. celatus DSM 18785]BCS58569.1 hypothetical protein ADLECEL_24540 [Adlercreutzia equolifaciens subsp. celatus]